MTPPSPRHLSLFAALASLALAIAVFTDVITLWMVVAWAAVGGALAAIALLGLAIRGHILPFTEGPVHFGVVLGIGYATLKRLLDARVVSGS